MSSSVHTRHAYNTLQRYPRQPQTGPTALPASRPDAYAEATTSLSRWLRAESDIPILMLTARCEPTDRIIGLEPGADDYMAKPFEPRKLVARIQTILRRVRDDRTERTPST
ncbi:CheY-like chemotaxis protein [Pseudomonas frederiksbergensis]